MSAVEADAFAPEGDEHEDREHYRIGGKGEADWALRKLSAARWAILQNRELAAQEHERIEDWLVEVNAQLDRDNTYFEAILRNWHQEQLEADPKAKTIKLPGGTLSARQNPPSVVIDDNDAFVKWALENHPAWVRVKYEPAKAEIKAAGGVDADTGEIAPGVQVVEGEMSWKAVTE